MITTEKEQPRSIYEIIQDVQDLDENLAEELIELIPYMIQYAYKLGFDRGERYKNPWNI